MLHNQKVNYAFIFLTSESDGLAYIFKYTVLYDNTTWCSIFI